MDQVKWKNFSLAILTMVRENVFQEFYDPNIPNPAYPEEKTQSREETPENVIYSTVTFGGDHSRRGVSGYIKEYFSCLNEESLQFQLWQAACDLFDSHYAFTVAFNNDTWHYLDEEDEEDENNDGAWEAIYEAKYEAEINLEEQISDLCRNIRKRKLSKNTIDYSLIKSFIAKDFKNKDWYQFDSWDAACKELLKNLELFLLALGSNKFLDKYFDKSIQTQWDNNVDNFDWRLNPILRDLYIGFLIRNPILVSDKGSMLKKPFLVLDYLIEIEDIWTEASTKGSESLVANLQPVIELDATDLVKKQFKIFNEQYNLDDFEALEKSINRQYE